MKVLIIGFSAIVSRRVLASLIALPNVESISVASRHLNSIELIPQKKRGKIYPDYLNALKLFKGDLVYISLPNSLHYLWAKKSLETGLHVILDKPSVIRYKDAQALVNLANLNQLCIAEANVWKYHPIAQDLLNIINKKGNPLYINAIFSSPKLNEDNFRYNKNLGSGVILDRGSYAISCGNFFFKNNPVNAICTINYLDMIRDVDISVSITLTYPCGSILNGFFSLNAEYNNSIVGVSQSYYFRVERVFTPPPDYTGRIEVIENNKQSIQSAKTGDSFALFINNIINSINNNNYEGYGNELLEDAFVMKEILKSSKLTR